MAHMIYMAAADRTRVDLQTLCNRVSLHSFDEALSCGLVFRDCRYISCPKAVVR